jgi:hypothetical protein
MLGDIQDFKVNQDKPEQLPSPGNTAALFRDSGTIISRLDP